MSYTVKIVDNKTGAVVADYDNVNIIMGVLGIEGGTHSLNAVDANGLEMGIAYHRLTSLVARLEQEHPEVKIVASMCEALEELETDDSDNEES